MNMLNNLQTLDPITDKSSLDTLIRKNHAANACQKDLQDRIAKLLIQLRGNRPVSGGACGPNEKETFEGALPALDQATIAREGLNFELSDMVSELEGLISF